MSDITAYEVAITKDGKTVEVLGYSERKTRGALIEFTRRNGPKVAALCTEAELDSEWKYKNGVLSFGTVAVAFNGFTKLHPSI